MEKTQTSEINPYEIVLTSDTPDQLADAILKIAVDGKIKGRNREFDAEKMASYVEGVVYGTIPANALTRNFGIRQQALYLRYGYEERNI